MICLKIFTANTFFYTIFIERLYATALDKNQKDKVKVLLPWNQVLYKSMKLIIKKSCESSTWCNFHFS